MIIKTKIYKTRNDGFLIQVMEDDNHCVVGRLVNNKVISITNEEQKICESEGYIVGDILTCESEGFKIGDTLKYLGLS